MKFKALLPFPLSIGNCCNRVPASPPFLKSGFHGFVLLNEQNLATLFYYFKLVRRFKFKAE
jgi:hypothetical protein